jgi:hypothetical protein
MQVRKYPTARLFADTTIAMRITDSERATHRSGHTVANQPHAIRSQMPLADTRKQIRRACLAAPSDPNRILNAGRPPGPLLLSSDGIDDRSQWTNRPQAPGRFQRLQAIPGAHLRLSLPLVRSGDRTNLSILSRSLTRSIEPWTAAGSIGAMADPTWFRNASPGDPRRPYMVRNQNVHVAWSAQYRHRADQIAHGMSNRLTRQDGPERRRRECGRRGTTSERRNYHFVE